jgi:hypothetical protein
VTTTETFCWELSDRTRAFTKRLIDTTPAMGVLHPLNPKYNFTST